MSQDVWPYSIFVDLVFIHLMCYFFFYVNISLFISSSFTWINKFYSPTAKIAAKQNNDSIVQKWCLIMFNGSQLFLSYLQGWTNIILLEVGQVDIISDQINLRTLLPSQNRYICNQIAKLHHKLKDGRRLSELFNLCLILLSFWTRKYV